MKNSPDCCFASVMCGSPVTEALGGSGLLLWFSAFPRKLVMKHFCSGNKTFVMSLRDIASPGFVTRLPVSCPAAQLPCQPKNVEVRTKKIGTSYDLQKRKLSIDPF